MNYWGKAFEFIIVKTKTEKIKGKLVQVECLI